MAEMPDRFPATNLSKETNREISEACKQPFMKKKRPVPCATRQPGRFLATALGKSKSESSPKPVRDFGLGVGQDMRVVKA